MIDFRIIVITDWSRADCLERVRAAVACGPRVAVQHRHPGATDRQLYEQGRQLREVIGAAPLFVNGRLDLALALDAHLHLTEGSLTPADVRPHLGARLLSASWHPPAPPRTGVDLLLASPVFEPLSKPAERPALGPSGYAAARARAGEVPVFALGGMTPERLDALGEVDGVAVIGASDRIDGFLARFAVG
ncbi:MAG: thiamine phosphate synthase [Myxococcota bacterium]